MLETAATRHAAAIRLAPADEGLEEDCWKGRGGWVRPAWWRSAVLVLSVAADAALRGGVGGREKRSLNGRSSSNVVAVAGVAGFQPELYICARFARGCRLGNLLWCSISAHNRLAVGLMPVQRTWKLGESFQKLRSTQAKS